MESYFTVFNIVQIAGIMFTAFLCVIIVREKSSMHDKLLGLVGICILFDLVGYLFEMNATGLNEALVCSKIELSSFLLIATFMTVLELMKLGRVEAAQDELCGEIILKARDISEWDKDEGFDPEDIYE